MLAFIVYQATPRDPLVLAGVVLATAVLGCWLRGSSPTHAQAGMVSSTRKVPVVVFLPAA